MSFSVIHLENLAELKTRYGGNNTTASLLGLNYPTTQGYCIYWWDMESTETPDDFRIVQVTGEPIGRWKRVDLFQQNANWTASSGVTQISNKPTLANVAISGSYVDLTNKPTIPSAQVQSNWTATSGMGAILNKPTLSTVATSGSYNDLTNKPTIPVVKRVETYAGSTDGSGNYTVTYSTPFSTVPDVQPQIQSGTPSQVVRITSSTTTGFTVQVTNRASVSLLGIEVLLASTTPVSGSSVGVLVTAR